LSEDVFSIIGQVRSRKSFYVFRCKRFRVDDLSGSWFAKDDLLDACVMENLCLRGPSAASTSSCKSSICNHHAGSSGHDRDLEEIAVTDGLIGRSVHGARRHERVFH
jgi:hypothetical protein